VKKSVEIFETKRKEVESEMMNFSEESVQIAEKSRSSIFETLKSNMTSIESNLEVSEKDLEEMTCKNVKSTNARMSSAMEKFDGNTVLEIVSSYRAETENVLDKEICERAKSHFKSRKEFVENTHQRAKLLCDNVHSVVSSEILRPVMETNEHVYKSIDTIVQARDTFGASMSNEMSCVKKTESSLQDTDRCLTESLDAMLKETESFSKNLCETTTSNLKTHIETLEHQGDSMLNSMSTVREETASSTLAFAKCLKDHVTNASKRVQISGDTPCKADLSRNVGGVSKIVSPLPNQSLRVLHRVGQEMSRRPLSMKIDFNENVTTTTTTKTKKLKKRKSDPMPVQKKNKKRKSDPVVAVLSESNTNAKPPRSSRKKRRATVHTPQDIKKHTAVASSKKKRRQRRASSIPLPSGDENSEKKVWNTPQRRGSSKLRRPTQRRNSLK